MDVPSKLRYKDTSFLIHKQWTMKHETIAFPTVVDYFSPFGNGIAAANDIYMHDKTKNFLIKTNSKNAKTQDVKPDPQWTARNRSPSEASENKENEKGVVVANIKGNRQNENESRKKHFENDMPIINYVGNINRNTTNIDSKLVVEVNGVEIVNPNPNINLYSDGCKEIIIETNNNNNNNTEEKWCQHPRSNQNKYNSEILNRPLTIQAHSDGVHALALKKQQRPSDPPAMFRDTESCTSSSTVELPQIQFYYVTEKILATILPDANDGNKTQLDSNSNELVRRKESLSSIRSIHQEQHERDLISSLEQTHGKNCKIFDLESCFATITLENLCELCKHIDVWLDSGFENVVVLQDRADRQRLGIAITSYLEYKKNCGLNISHSPSFDKLIKYGERQHQPDLNWLDFDVLCMQKFLEDNVGPIKVPSYQRYAFYFSRLLSGHIKFRYAHVFLEYITIQSPPCWHRRAVTYNNEWRCFVEIFEGEECAFTSDIYVVPIMTREFFVTIKQTTNKLTKPLSLRGDITIKCYQMFLNTNIKDELFFDKELISSIQFHTCAVEENELQFTKSEIDLACNDERFNSNHKWILSFLQTQSVTSQTFIQNPLVHTEQHAVEDKIGSFGNLSLEDQHRELDELLSDMLMISDYETSINNKNELSHFQIHDRSKYQQQHTSKGTAKQQSNRINLHQSVKPNITKPFNNCLLTTVSHLHNDRPANIGETLAYKQRRNSSESSYKRDGAAQETESEQTTMNSQHNSIGCSPSPRSDSFLFLSDDYSSCGESGPYHLRENSQPFSYINVHKTPGEKMIRSKPGLSSPSMVRKTLKTPPPRDHGGMPTRNDFDDILREHREKMFNEKYTIRDQPTTFSENSSSNYKLAGDKWHGSEATNGYYGSLKRSNTMDGSFGRTQSFDGYSGQTWLQLQQQKLRAKRGYQSKDNFDIFAQPIFANNSLSNSNVERIRTKTLSPVSNENRYYHTVTTTRKEDAFDQGKHKLYGASEESFSYHSDAEPVISRPNTPAFPLSQYSLSTECSPALPPKSPSSHRKELHFGNQTFHEFTDQIANTISEQPKEVPASHVKFVKDSAKYWYKPNISREDAISLLRHTKPGTFVVRDSTTFANAFGLVVKVAHPPPNAAAKSPRAGDELVRHFLIEPTLKGVRLKGCSNEPVFSSLSALVYQHSITPLALPCRLLIPTADILNTEYKQLIEQGAACNVLYLFTVNTELLTGPQAVRKAVERLFMCRPLPLATQVHFKVTQQGITLTDNTRKLFFRKHYPSITVSFCGMDPEERRWNVQNPYGEVPVASYRIFAFVAKQNASSYSYNQCHLFAEFEPSQPATAIVSFCNKILIDSTISANV